MRFSLFGERFSRRTGARELMDDMGAAMAADAPVMMLGGGNPALIPEMLALFRERFFKILADEREFRRMIADYAQPAGEVRFRQALAELLKREYGWALRAENIALTTGSQSGFFQLFNLLAGPIRGGEVRKILLPVTPEYIGYQDTGVEGEIFTSRRPMIEELGGGLFKYRVDFEHLDIGADIAAICVSRPTNPSGNVLTDEELNRLAMLARSRQIPLIVDSAYGLPFPRIVYTEASPRWDNDIILCMSLSKLGLPAVRTGIVIAREDIIDALAGMNAIMSLAVSSVGPVLMRDLIATGEIIRVSQEVIRPFYQRRAEQALAWLHEALAGVEYRIHRPEGAFFLWLWLPDLPISSRELYSRLKALGVLVLSGHHFFPGLAEPWRHREECLRISYTQEPDIVRRGIGIIGGEVRRAFNMG
jgi:valine--pyruvate aminotransferase